MEKEIIINRIVEEIKKMPNGAEVCVGSLFYEIYGDKSQLIGFNLFNIYYGVVEELQKVGIELDCSRFAGQIVGLLYNLPLIVKKY